MNETAPSQKAFNQLAESKSPYLLQHADNPVFLSIGYATCHWCHVMAHESFEDTEVADYLNEHFVSIKVDREERAEQVMTTFSAQIISHPMAFTQFLAAYDFIIGPSQEIVVVGDPKTT